MELGHWPKFHKLHICSLSTPGGGGGLNFSLLNSSTGSGFRAVFKLAMYEHDTWSLTKDPAVAYKLCLPQGAKLSVNSLYGQRFPRHWPIFKIAFFCA